MTILVSNNATEEFVLKTVKEYLITYYHLLFKNKNDTVRIEHFNKYLKENYKVSISDILESVDKNIVLSIQGDNYKLSVNEVVTIGGRTLGMFMRLIDYGNSDIRGMHLFDKAEKFIQKKLQSLLTIHTLKNLKKEDSNVS